MLKLTEQNNFDWHKNKTFEVKKRGNMALVLPALNLSNPKQSMEGTRCMWPDRFDATSTKYMSRRVWGAK